MKRYMLLFVLVFLNSCATRPSPYQQYEYVGNNATIIAQNNLEAIKNAPPLSLPIGRTMNTEINLNDPVIKYNEKVLSNYKIFSFYADRKTHFNIEFRSLCNCLGTEKFILYPIAYILDSSGNIINGTPSNTELSDPDWTYPVNIHMTWEGFINDSGTYYFFVSAYNFQVGAAFMDFSEYRPVEAYALTVPGVSSFLNYRRNDQEPKNPFEFDLWSYPTGKIAITLSLSPE